MEPSFVVTGNQPVVIRESLLPRAFEMAEGTVAASFELEDESRGAIGPFCLETIVTDSLEFKVFEIGARIVLVRIRSSLDGSPYSDINETRMSTGRRIARSVRNALKNDRLDDILSDINLSQVLVERQSHRLLVHHQVHFRLHRQDHQTQPALGLPHQQ